MEKDREWLEGDKRVVRGGYDGNGKTGSRADCDGFEWVWMEQMEQVFLPSFYSSVYFHLELWLQEVGHTRIVLG